MLLYIVGVLVCPQPGTPRHDPQPGDSRGLFSSRSHLNMRGSKINGCGGLIVIFGNSGCAGLMRVFHSPAIAADVACSPNQRFDAIHSAPIISTQLVFFISALLLILIPRVILSASEGPQHRSSCRPA